MRAFCLAPAVALRHRFTNVPPAGPSYRCPSSICPSQLPHHLGQPSGRRRLTLRHSFLSLSPAGSRPPASASAHLAVCRACFSPQRRRAAACSGVQESAKPYASTSCCAPEAIAGSHGRPGCGIAAHGASATRSTVPAASNCTHSHCQQQPLLLAPSQHRFLSCCSRGAAARFQSLLATAKSH